MLADLDERELERYRSEVVLPEDFREFWSSTLAESRSAHRDPLLSSVRNGLRTLEHADVTFTGFAGHPIRGWYVRPAGVADPLPGLVLYVGYGGGRGTPLENLVWASAGYAVLIMDNRGQGAGFRHGVTADPVPGVGVSSPGFLTQGIGDPRTSYYRRLITDAVRAVDTLRMLPGVDPERVGTVGMSQGGALALAAGALHPDVAATASFVPFLCDIRRGTRVTDSPPYVEIARYLEMHRDQVERSFRTLAYVDGVNFARVARAPLLTTTSLMDAVCPPSTVFGMFHEYAGPKRLQLWEYNDHNGGGVEDERLALEFFDETLRAPVRRS